MFKLSQRVLKKSIVFEHQSTHAPLKTRAYICELSLIPDLVVFDQVTEYMDQIL